MAPKLRALGLKGLGFCWAKFGAFLTWALNGPSGGLAPFQTLLASLGAFFKSKGQHGAIRPVY
jgi:hypothetical protein